MPVPAEHYRAYAAEVPGFAPPLTDIAPRHPKRLRPNVPLNPVEQRLEREMSEHCRQLRQLLS